MESQFVDENFNPRTAELVYSRENNQVVSSPRKLDL